MDIFDVSTITHDVSLNILNFGNLKSKLLAEVKYKIKSNILILEEKKDFDQSQKKKKKENKYSKFY